MSNNPINHHYVPVFYLQRWASGKDKRLWYYQKNVKGNIVERRIGPKSTGYEPSLNTLKAKEFSGINSNQKYFIEHKLAALDSDASRILDKMTSKGIPSLSVREKTTWLNFVFLLIERNPQRINTIEKEGENILKDVIDDSMKKWGNHDQWNHTYEILKSSEFTYNHARIRLNDFLKDSASLSEQFIQNWLIVQTQTPFEFFTTNFPVIVEVSKNSSDEISFIEMPLSPQELWICAPSNFQFDKELIKLLVITLNIRFPPFLNLCLKRLIELHYMVL
jgi:hypothetical protein